MRGAAAEGLAAVPRGSGTRLAWGGPPTRCDLVLDTRRMNRVLEHAAGDQVVRVQAGVGLDQLAAVLAGAGQRLALDPPPPAPLPVPLHAPVTASPPASGSAAPAPGHPLRAARNGTRTSTVSRGLAAGAARPPPPRYRTHPAP